MKTYELPQRFLDDHYARELADGVTYIGKRGRCYLVTMTEEAYAEMLSDADFYGDASYIIPEMGPEFLGLSRSAKATADRLRKAGPPSM